MPEENEEAICACDAIKSAFRQTKEGVAITFILHPQDVNEKLAMLGLGEVIRLYVTRPQMGL